MVRSHFRTLLRFTQLLCTTVQRTRAAPSAGSAEVLVEELSEGRKRILGIPGGRIPLLRGRPGLLVLYHYFERESTCPEDEEIAVMRTNLLYFIRC